MTDWSHELILEFLELYKNESILWDPMHPWPRDKTKVNDAWLNLSEILQRPVSELKKKKDSLMATFRGHLRKKKASIKSGGDIYKPVWFAYEFMESFLGPVYECTTITDAQDAIETYVVGPEFDEENEGDTTDLVPVMPGTSTSTSTRLTTVRRRRPTEIQEQGKEGNSILNNISNKRTNKDEDECDLFAKILAKKLRKLPEHERFLFMYEIDGMFISRLCGENSTLPPSMSFSHVSSADYMNGPSASQATQSDSSDS